MGGAIYPCRTVGVGISKALRAGRNAAMISTFGLKAPGLASAVIDQPRAGRYPSSTFYLSPNPRYAVFFAGLLLRA
jgi:hypothetical protein